MHCLVLRHTAAEDTAPDADRALTARGMRRAERIARVLAGLAPDTRCVAASPLRRAQQTAAPLAGALELAITTVDALAPGRWRELWPWLAGVPGGVCLVGHAPDLDHFICAALTGRAGAFVALKKGGAAWLEFPGAPCAGTACLRWLLTPRQLLGVAAR